MITLNNRLAAILGMAALLLLIPFAAMQFTEEVNWSLFDFLVAGFLLVGSGLLLETILKNVRTTKLRVLLIIGLFLVLFLVWAELAVGIFGTPFAGS